ncbi:MAG: penicillin-binding transpeptidase domain-containing protein [Saprospiraceae bacterium]
MTTKFVLLVSFFALLVSCKNKEVESISEAPQTEALSEVKPAFQHVLDSAGLNGSILIFNPKKRTYYSNDFQWAKTGQLPASTFKIPNSIIALETGVITNKDVIIPWDGTTRGVANWNQDLPFSDAFAYSCVPCYQSIARQVGNDRMLHYIDRLGYPGISFEADEIDMFWLTGKSRINQFEQIEFIERLFNKELPIAAKTSQTVRDIMQLETSADYTLRGKTGWSTSAEKDNGWFVGVVQKPSTNKTSSENHVLYFATNIEPKEGTPIEAFITGRRGVTEAAIRSLNWP